MAVTPTPPISPAPATPQRLTDSPETFVEKSDPWMDWMATVTEEVEATAEAAESNATAAETAAGTAESASTAAVNAGTLIATVSTSLSLTTGAKAISWAETGRTFANTRQCTLIRASDPTQKMWGALSLVDNTAKTATLTVATSGEIAGSGGPYTDWILVDSWLERLSEATVAQVRTKAAHVAVSPDVGRDAAAAAAVTMGATVTVDGADGLRRTLACNGSFTLAAPTNVDPGDVIEIDVTHSSNNNVLAVNSALKRQNGLGVLSITSGHRDLIVILVQAVDGSRVCTRGVYQVIRNPT